MAFWGSVVKPGKSPGAVYVPELKGGEGTPPDLLHLSQASLLATGKRASLLLKHKGEGATPICICTLTDSLPSQSLDLFIDAYTEFSVVGDVEVHLSGYFAPNDGLAAAAGNDSDDDDEYVGEGESDDEEDDEDEDGEDDGGMIVGKWPAGMLLGDDDDDDEDDDEDETDDMSDDDEGMVPSRQPSVVIEELEDEPQAPAQQAKKRAAPESEQEKPKKKQAAEQKQQQQQQQQQQEKSKEKKKEEKKKEEKQQTPIKAAASASAAAGEVKTNKKNVRRWENGFEIEEVAMGQPNGKLAKSGKKLVVHYVGRLKHNGKVFDQSKGKPFTFRLGVGEVIKGWDLGMEGMRVGDKRRLVIPPQLAYGSGGVKGAIPPNATLEFDVTLVDVK